MKISELFKEEPQQWGLRGDPHLWKEMASELRNTDTPPTVEELKTILEETYENSTGKGLNHNDFIFIDRFDHGGMSRGKVCPEFWRKKAFPLLLSRFNETTK